MSSSAWCGGWAGRPWDQRPCLLPRWTHWTLLSSSPGPPGTSHKGQGLHLQQVGGMSNSPPEWWEAQERGTLMWLMASGGTRGPHCPVQSRRCQDCEQGLGDKWARGSGEQCLDVPGEVDKDSDACQGLSLHPLGGVKGTLPPHFSGEAHQGLSPTTQVQQLPMAPSPA